MAADDWEPTRSQVNVIFWTVMIIIFIAFALLFYWIGKMMLHGC